MFRQEENCGNCFFYMAVAKVCRRNPPTPLFLGVRQGLGGQEPVIQAFFPPMMPNGWCGHHDKVEEAESSKDN